MRHEVRMGNLGNDMQSDTLAQWPKAIGEAVTEGEPLAEIATDKANLELEAPTSETLVEIAHGAGDEVPVGDVIGYLERD